MSVQSPARKRFWTGVWAGGRKRSEPGRHRKVAFSCLTTRERTTRACFRFREYVCHGGHAHLLQRLLGLVNVIEGGAEGNGDVLALCASLRSIMLLLLKTHCKGESTRATKSCSMTGLSYQR